MTDDVFCLIASGPSLEMWQVGHAVKSGAKIIAINNNYEICPEADFLYGCDAEWWKHHNGAPQFLGRKFSLEMTEYHDVYQLTNTGEAGIDFEWPNVRTGLNSGYQAMNLAIHLGARKIILIGYDMQHTNGKRHWHADHPGNNCQHIKDWVRHYDNAAKIFKEKGIEVINCTIKTALTCFERADLRDVL